MPAATPRRPGRCLRARCLLVLGLAVSHLALSGRHGLAAPAPAPAPVPASPSLARTILADTNLTEVLSRARALLATGLNAGDGYGEVWIRDLNTFLDLALGASPDNPARLRGALLTFFKFQEADGNIVDGYIPAAKAGVGYKYRKSDLAPALLAHKNTVETDQESSLVLAVARYLRGTGDSTLLDETIGGRSVLDRLDRALEYPWQHRFSPAHGLIWGATTVDWGDVQPEHEWGVELDASSHRAIDVYDNALYLSAIQAYLEFAPAHTPAPTRQRWTERARQLRLATRKHLWDAERAKFVPHLYLDSSPFPADFDERAVWYHGGTAVAMEAGLLSPGEVRRSLEALRANVRTAGAASLGLTVHPPYPDGFFKNKSMRAWSYQNGGDWCWFGGRLIQQLIRHGLVEEAYHELQPMTRRVLQHQGFFEWWTRDNQPRGSGQFRGSAGVLGQAILDLRAWAETHKQILNKH